MFDHINVSTFTSFYASCYVWQCLQPIFEFMESRDVANKCCHIIFGGDRQFYKIISYFMQYDQISTSPMVLPITQRMMYYHPTFVCWDSFHEFIISKLGHTYAAEY